MGVLALLAALASAGGAPVLAVPRSESTGKPAPRGSRAISGSGAGSDCDDGPKAAFALFLGKPEGALNSEKTFAGEVRGKFQTVVVTIPDPIDSRLDSDFDETLTALSLAAAVRGYALDRYWLPWQLDRREIEAKGTLKGGGCHAVQPGLVLYRRTAAAKREQHLAFLLVGETPTTGIHRLALNEALKIVEAAGETSRARVLGPSFSGTFPSLACELRPYARAGWGLKIVTGSATAIHPDRGDADSATLPLQSTVHDDNEMGYALSTFLDQYLHIEREDVALLIESDSAYGVAFTAPAGGKLNEYYASTIIRFPMQISRIRSDYQRQRVRQQLKIGGYAVPPEALELQADANHDPKDVLPPLTNASENYAEEVLASELDLLRKHRVRAVGVLATDPLDKSFLVSKLRELAPDVLVFTFESSLLFLHPDVRRAMYGSLVVSTYPLLLEAQSWSSGGPPREGFQFPSSDAEGIYNAATLLLAKGANEQTDDDPGEYVRDYEYPFHTRVPKTGCPPVWISVVGHDALWPVWVHGCEKGTPPLADVPLELVTPAARASGSSTGAGSPSVVHGPHASREMLLFTALVLAGAAVIAVRAFAGKGYASARAGSTRCDHRWIIAHLLWLALVLLALSVFLFIPVCAFVDGGVERLCLGAGNDEHVDLWTLDMARLAAAVTGLVLAAANWEAWKLARWRARRDRGESAGDVPPPLGPTRTWLAAGATTFVLGLAVMYVGAPALAKLATPTDPTGRTWTLLLFERAVHLGNGVSPLLPLLFPALAVHLWTLGQLVRIRLLRGHDVGTGERLFRRFAGADDPVLRETDKRLLELVRGRFSRRELIRTVLFAIPALAVLSYAWHFLHSPDGPKFDHLFAGLLATVVLITGHSLLRAWRLWSALRTALERLRLHEVGKALQRLPELLQQQRLRRLFLWAPQYADLQRSYEIFCKAFPPPMRAEAHRRIEGGLAKDRRVPLRARWDSPTLAALADAAEESRGGDPNCGQATSNFVASQLALTILWVLAHLRLRLVHLVLSAVAILCAVAFYPLQAHRALMLLIWIVVLGAAGIAVVIYVHHDRNEVLSWLNGTPVGRVTLDTEHVVHFVTLGAAPLLALLAFQFPAFGHWLAGWLGPLFGGAR